MGNAIRKNWRILVGATIAALLLLMPAVKRDSCDVCFAQGQQVFTACTYQGGTYDDCHAQANAVACVCYVQNACGDGIIIACGGGQ